MKKVLVLGSTGSIGVQALEVIAENPHLAVAGLAAGRNIELLSQQAEELGVRDLAVFDEQAGSELAERLPDHRICTGSGCLRALIGSVDCDLVLNAVVGAAGLEATVATLERGIDLALANKESLVVGGDLVMQLAAERKARILPVDSEHSAIFQCLQGQQPPRQLILTASGGPFFGRSREELSSVSREDALAHPRWQMGSKISIDSATLMNKGLEIIEAHHLFGVAYDDIDVLVHPQSIVHSLVRFNDGSLLAQLGLPSMKLPIAYALNYPERMPVTMPQLDLAAEGELTFARPDLDAFPALRLAQEAGLRGGAAPVALNAANEVAVAAFLEGRLDFLAIADIVGRTMDQVCVISGRMKSLDEITQVDAEARERAEALINA